MTYPPCSMPAPVPASRCDRVPPAHAQDSWDALDMRLHLQDDLPQDPRTWSRTEVGVWAARGGGRAERFPMNGKALCLMTRDMFAARVPNHGDKLYYDFRRRLAKALALQELIEKMSSHYD